jgi:lysyl endopeptidase
MKFKLLFAILFVSLFTFAQQIPDNIKPPSWSLESLNTIRPHKLASFDIKKLMDEDKINDKDKSIP